MAPVICCIDGNIGAGKSTVLDILKGRGYTVLKEDVEDWQPYLNLFYRDETRWALTLQMQVLQSIVSSYDKIKDVNKIVFVERDPESCMLFSKNSFKRGYMNKEEYNLFNTCYDLFKPWKSDARIFLDVNVSTCLDRIKQRSRTGEDTVTEEYLTSLNKEYDDLDKINITAYDDPNEIADKILVILSWII